jgi:hypothetical protein
MLELMQPSEEAGVSQP